jgi:hypothetical protein
MTFHYLSFVKSRCYTLTVAVRQNEILLTVYGASFFDDAQIAEANTPGNSLVGKERRHWAPFAARQQFMHAGDETPNRHLFH